VFFQNKYSKGVMDVRGGSSEPGTQIWQFKLNYTIAQIFFLSLHVDGTYSIISRVPEAAHLLLSLKYNPPTKTIEAPTSTSGTYSQYLLVQEEPYPPSSSPVAGTPLPVHQKWKIVPVPNEANTYRIQSAAFTGSEVVLEASSQESGTPLRLSVYSGKTSQKWVIQRTAVSGQATNVQVSDLTWIPMWGCDRVQGRLTWTDEASNNTGFEIAAGGPGWAQKFTTGATSQSFSIDIAVSEEAEPGDTYCFIVSPFNPWGYGYSDSDCATADIKTTTPPPPPGVGAIRVFNCHNGQQPVRIWTYDLTVNNGQWQDRGAIPSQWSGSSCPGNATPLTFSLTDGHNYVLKAIDCGNGTPPQTQGSCHRLTTTNALPGKTGGTTLTFTVN
ncbi:MAG: RICIN domain-containing protein, partial [Thermoanaerobaculia bacterium]|nr:RICIN domain-containing protein [Thermoanaerobaculia bacterium]